MNSAEKTSKAAQGRSTLVTLLVIALLAGLPLAVWLDMRSLSDSILARQSDEISRVINDMRNFYSNDVVGRLVGHQTATPTHN
ncbi:MAG: adenylate/guanylate cyclase domain-containing protein, partial [Pseudorhodoplanes sp.]|nr:adenylate/guanylate cyclase domain-containing protein [Pseudorhodoplanes sp.]